MGSRALLRVLHGATTLLAAGEYVAVEKLENTYKKCSLVEQVWVYGNSFESTLVAVVVPNANLKKWAAEHGIAGEMSDIVKDDKVKKHVLQELAATGKADKLKGFEMIKDVTLDDK